MSDDQSSDRSQSDQNNTRAVEERETARQQAATNQGIMAGLIQNLIDANKEQSVKSEQLAQAAYTEALSRVEMQERAKLARNRFRITILLLLAGIAGLLFLVNRNLDSGKSVRKTLLDCVQPTGVCYKQGQEQTAKLVGNLNQVSVLAAACAPDYVRLPLPARIVAIEKCIRRGLNGAAPPLTPTRSPSRPSATPSATPNAIPSPRTHTETVVMPGKTTTRVVTTTARSRPQPTRTVTASPPCLLLCLPTFPGLPPLG